MLKTQRFVVGLAVLWLVAVTALVLLSGCGGGASDKRADEVTTTAAGEETRYIIALHNPPDKAMEDLVRAHGGRIRYSYRIIPAIAAVLPPSAVAALEADPRVKSVRKALQRRLIAQETPWGIARVKAPEVHAAGNKGTGVKVAIIDTGINYNHPDLQANYKGGYDFVQNDADPRDDHGHGSHCAGIVGAADNTIGVIGVAPEAWLYGVKVLNFLGIGWEDDIIAGIQWCAINGMQVASMSFGGSGYSPEEEQACNAAYSQGVLLVAAAGNSGAGADKVEYPAKFNSVIAVAATDQNNNRASFSSTGPAVELAAPGVGIKSTVLGSGYDTWDGTSMACPHVSGAAALLIRSGLTTPAAIRQRLQQTAVDLGPPGRDTSFGYGLIDCQAAVGGGPPPPPPPPPSNSFRISSISMSLVNLRGARYARAVVTVVNGTGGPVSAVTVNGHWEGLATNRVSGRTNNQGTVTFTSTISRASSGTFTFVVDSASKPGMTWDQAGSVTSNSISF